MCFTGRALSGPRGLGIHPWGAMASLRSVVRYMRNPRALRDRWRIHRDLQIFRRSYGSRFAASGPTADPEGRLLVVGLHGFIPAAKEEGVYTKALEWRGYTPYILAERGSMVVPYYQVFGIDRLVFFSDFVEAVPRTPVLQQAQEVVVGASRAAELVNLRYRDVYVGRHVLSLLTRRLHAGKLDLRDPRIAERLTEMLAEAMRAVHAAEAMLAQVKPEIILFNERGYTPFGEIFDVALNRKLNVIQYVASHRDDARIFKRYTSETYDVHPHSLSEDSWEDIRAMPWDERREQELTEEIYGHYETGTWFNFQRLQHGKRIKSKEEVRAQLGLDARKKTAVIFSHIFWDATFFYGDSLFEDYEEWLVQTVRTACANTAVNWIVKLHPVNVWRLEADGYIGDLAERVALRKRIGALPGHIYLVDPDTDINTYSLFGIADFGLTVRGTVGIEMAMFGIPVFTAGTGRYSGLGFTVDFARPEEYLAALGRIQDYPALTPEQVTLARKYAYGIFKLRPLRFTTFQPIYSSAKGTFHALDGSVVIRARTLRELAESLDLGSWAAWASDSRRLDYLIPVDGAVPAYEHRPARQEDGRPGNRQT